MGIKNLNNLLRKKCPHVFEEIHLSEYAFKKVAIDVSLFLCKFKAICGDNWLTSFVNLVQCLRKNDIHCVFIFDNGSPNEKSIEKEERIKSREKTEHKVLELSNALDNYYKTGEVDPILLELHDKLIKKSVPVQRLLSKKRPQSSINMDMVKDKIEKMKNYNIRISKDDFEKTRELFDILKVPYYIAPLEAECMCADLCKRNIVDAVLTEDTDVLAYGSPVFLSKIDTKNDTCVRILHKTVLDSLSLTQEQFLDLCIMCGCDYNKNIPKVGCETSFKYITKYKSIDEIERNESIDITILNHKRTRDLFINYERHEIKNISYCGSPDFNELQKFTEKNNININSEKLKKSFVHDIIFVEDE
jgi:flap endonuclease-1